MNKNIYLFLFGISLTSTLGITYYAFTLGTTPPPIVNPVKVVAEVATSTTKEYPTKTDVIFSVQESHPNGMSLSTITVTGKNFKEESSVTFEKETVKNIFVNDIDNNGFSELYVVTQSAGSGSYGEIVAIISNKDISFTKVELPTLTSEDMATSSPFEGYQGHDSYKIENGLLVRSFPVHTATSTNTSQTNLIKQINYKLIQDEEAFAFVITNDLSNATTSATIATSTIASSTPKSTTPNKTSTTTSVASTSPKTTTKVR